MDGITVERFDTDWPKSYFDRHGLFNLKAARELEAISLRIGAKC